MRSSRRPTILRPRVLLRDARAELDVRAQGLPERRIVWQARVVDGLHVERDEAFTLLVRDPEPAVYIDHVLKTKLAREPVRAAERLGRKPRQVLHVMRSPLREKRLQHWIGENLRIEI